MSRHEHLFLLIEYRDGRPLKEPVHVEPLGNNTFQLLFSPGLVQGIAAGDVLRVLDEDGTFEVLARGGQLAVQVFAREAVRPFAPHLIAEVEAIGGRLDGEIDRGLVFTLPIGSGFGRIEQTLDRWVAEHPGWEWSYGNVYAKDGVTLLNWWNE